MRFSVFLSTVTTELLHWEFFQYKYSKDGLSFPSWVLSASLYPNLRLVVYIQRPQRFTGSTAFFGLTTATINSRSAVESSETTGSPGQDTSEVSWVTDTSQYQGQDTCKVSLVTVREINISTVEVHV